MDRQDPCQPTEFADVLRNRALGVIARDALSDKRASLVRGVWVILLARLQPERRTRSRASVDLTVVDVLWGICVASASTGVKT